MVKSFDLMMKLSWLGKEMFIKKLYQLYFSSEVQQYLTVLSCLKVSSLMFAVSKVNRLCGHTTTVLGIHCELVVSFKDFQKFISLYLF